MTGLAVPLNNRFYKIDFLTIKVGLIASGIYLRPGTYRAGITHPTKDYANAQALLITQGLDGIEARRLACRIDAEDDADTGGKDKGQQHGAGGHG